MAPAAVENDRAAAAADAVQRGKRHCECVAAGEADHLAGNPACACLDRQTRAHGHCMDRPCHFNHQPAHGHHAAINLDPVDVDDLLRECLHRFARL